MENNTGSASWAELHSWLPVPPALPTDNLYLHNIISGHAHKQQNGVLPETR